MPGAGLGTIRQLQLMLSALDRPLPRRRYHERDLKAASRPSSFALFSDPLDRYEFKYPAEWTLKEGAAPAVSSPKLGLFVRVDLLPAEGEPLPLLTERYPGLSIRTWRAGLPSRAEGILAWRDRRFTWTSSLFELRETRIAFSTGSVLDDAAKSIQAYRRNILAAIRRHFRLAPGLRSD
jgi:hypothetical protein